MKSIVYTPEVNISNEIEKITSLFEAGVDFLYLRKPNISSAYWYAYLEQLPYGFEDKIVTNDFQLLHDMNLGGFHFQRDIIQSLSMEDLRENLLLLHQKNKISSATAHDFDELRKYDGLFTHVLISPIFDSISKSDYTSGWNLEELKAYISNRNQSQTLLFAQGGIDEKKIDIIHLVGLDGVTLLGYLWNDAEQAVEKFKNLKLNS